MASEKNQAQPSPAGQGDAPEIERIRTLVSSILSTVSLGHQRGPYAYAGEDFGRYLEEATRDCRTILRALSDLAAPRPVAAAVKDSLTVGVGQAAGQDPVAEAWIVVKEYAWDHGDGGRPTLAYLWPSEFERRVYPTFAAASEFIKSGDWPLGFVAMQIQAPPAQTVDLWQFRESVLQEFLREDDAFQRGFLGHKQYAEAQAKCDRLLALIDSQAVGNG
jgi:hypothetical protein